MNRGDSIRRIKAAARSRSLLVTDHAALAALDDGEDFLTICDAIARAATFQRQPDGTWRVHGNGLTAIVAVRDRVIVLTVFV